MLRALILKTWALKETLPSVQIFAVSLSIILLTSGCGQSVDDVSIDQRGIIATPKVYISTVDIQGGTSVTPTSTNHILSVHSLGGSNLRTDSASTSYRMVSGIGID